MLFASRSSSEPDPLYPWKALSLVTGIGLFLLGVRLEMRWVTWIGVGAMVVAMLLRFVGPRRDPKD